MIAETIPQLNDLSADQKIILAAELWRDALGETSSNVPDPEMVAALRERLDHYQKHPNQVASRETVRARILSRSKGS